MRKRWYVGRKWPLRQAFQATETPTAARYPEYAAVVGPFRTKRAALWYEKNSYIPLGLTVSEIERVALEEVQ